MLTITPPPIHFSSFYLFFFTFQKNVKIPGGGVKPHEIRPCVLSINKNVFLKILNSPSKICEARDNIIIYRSEQRPLTYFLLRIFFLKLLKILEINESRLNSSGRSFEIWYWRFQGISIKRVIFSRSPGAKIHQYRLNCRHIYVDLMAIETMKSFICFDSIDYLHEMLHFAIISSTMTTVLPISNI